MLNCMFSYRHIKYLNANVPVERSVFSCLYFLPNRHHIGRKMFTDLILETKMFFGLNVSVSLSPSATISAPLACYWETVSKINFHYKCHI